VPPWREAGTSASTIGSFPATSNHHSRDERTLPSVRGLDSGPQTPHVKHSPSTRESRFAAPPHRPPHPAQNWLSGRWSARSDYFPKRERAALPRYRL
jgi:hypothetical protein